ncbi:MAG: 23S rRNA (uracil(1939)-C(5))-methyltransferase RlmD [Clostridiales bacterium]|nr:23S rRNA (uracil(1939)-C(5))-methyltransferase RlmD [Clostridiales bacterium]
METEIFSAYVPEMNSLGNGICKLDGCVVFCMGAVDGDRVQARIVDSRKNYKIAAVVSCDVPSPFRCDPACPAFGTCGGCTLQHITYAHELEVKKASVEAALRRAGLGTVNVEEILSADHMRYRNKAVYHFSEDSKISFLQESSNQYVPVSDCLLCPEVFSEIARDTESFFTGKSAVPSYLYIRADRTLSQLCVVLGVEGNSARDEAEEYATYIREKHPEIVGVLTGGGKHPEEKGTKLEILWGRDYIEESFLGLTLKITASSFFQVNTAAAELLCRRAVELLNPAEGEYGVDLYCGTGIFGMAIAKQHPDVYVTGVEINAGAVADAKANAAVNGLSNVGFFCGDSADFAKSTYGSIDFALIDPPRAGCSDKMLQALCKLRPGKILYVSCEPGTLGRDLKKLSEKGYGLDHIVACDLFPRTKHVECVALMSRKGEN